MAFDVDPVLTSGYRANHPTTRLVHADVAALSGSIVERLAGGAVDGVFGGPPCQGFSEIGRRRPDDPRRTLLGHFFRLVEELKPSFFVMENVKGLGYSSNRPTLDAALEVLNGKFTIIGPIVLNAADFGAATTRPRLFVFGFDSDKMQPFSLEDIIAERRSAATVSDALADLRGAEFVEDRNGVDYWRLKECAAGSPYSIQLHSDDRRFTHHRRTAHRKETADRFAKLRPGEMDPVGRHQRLDWLKQCPTIRAGTGADHGSFQSVRPIHPEEPRVITVREAARLQGFPDWFCFHPTIWHSFRMIGNSVSPIIAKAIFSVIAERMGIEEPARSAAE